MGAVFQSTVTQSLQTSGFGFSGVFALSGPAFTIGCWVYPTTTAAIKRVWSINGASGSVFSSTIWSAAQVSGGGVWGFQCADNAAADTIAVAGTATPNQWHFLLARAISTANRRLSVINADGTISHGQETSTLAPALPLRLELGRLSCTAPSGFFDGIIGEFWVMSGDVLASGGTNIDDN